MSECAAGGDQAARLFHGLAEIVYDHDNYQEVYRRLCVATPTLVTGCDHASLMLRRGSRLTTVAATDDIAARIDAMEREVGDGPCLDAIVDDAAYVDPSLPDGSRWPQLAQPIVTETPVRGIAGFRMLVNVGKVGSLNLFSATPPVD